jgi:putative oxidoreductase
MDMADLRSVAVAWAPRLLSVMRVVLAFTFMAHGMQKLFGFPAPMQLPPGAPPPPAFIVYLGGGLELVGGLLLLVGLFTRPVAFVLSGMMAVAYWMAHGPNGFWPLLNGGELAVVYCFAFLYLAAAGGGPWSADAALRRA